MPKDITQEKLVATAQDLDQDQFTRADLADKLGVEKSDLKDSFRQARKAGRLDKVGEDSEGNGQFKLTGE